MDLFKSILFPVVTCLVIGWALSKVIVFALKIA